MKKILGLLAIVCLNGCGNQAFDCPYKEGLRCVRLSEVDRRIDEGTLIKAVAPTPEGSTLQIQNADPKAPGALTLWVAPYQSKEGIIHEQQWIHFFVSSDEAYRREPDLD
jgi:hypothetical protein